MTEGAAGTPLPAKPEGPRLPRELTEQLTETGLLPVFEQLPATDQENFIRWVASGKADKERAKRIGTLLHALSLSPLDWESRPGLPNGRRAR